MNTPLWNVIHQRASLIREPNEIRVLRVVRDRGEISRIEIAKATRLHKATITDIVAKLIRAGFLEETGEVEARRMVGRKRVLLRFRPLAGIVAGVDIGMTHTTVALTDLNARILRQQSFHYPLDVPLGDVMANVIAAIQAMVFTPEYSQSKLVGIGVGIQGIIDYKTNVLLVSQNKKTWEGESLTAPLESKFNVPVFVENDVKTMALGEYLFGAAKGAKNFIDIWVGDGVGAGIMINGHLLHGITSSAGEIGYNGLDDTRFFQDKFPLTYRGQVMFGDILTDANVVESYRTHSGDPAAEKLAVADVVRKAEEGNQIARGIIDEYASLLSILCIGMVNTLNPELILVGGKLAQLCPSLAVLVQEKIRKDLLTAPAEAVHVRAARHGENGVIFGAAGLTLYEFFEPLHRISDRSVRRQAGVKLQEAAE